MAWYESHQTVVKAINMLNLFPHDRRVLMQAVHTASDSGPTPACSQVSSDMSDLLALPYVAPAMGDVRLRSDYA